MTYLGKKSSAPVGFLVGPAGTEARPTRGSWILASGASPSDSSLAAVDRPAPPQAKKADGVEHRKVFDHAGLLANEPPGTAGLPFI